MASESEAARDAAQVVLGARAAAVQRAAVPLWYWVVVGAALGFVGFALSFGSFPLSIAALLVIGVGSPILNAVLVRAMGIRVKTLAGEAGWLVPPFVVLIGGDYVFTFLVLRSTGEWWMGVLASVVAVLITGAFGRALESLRRHTEAPED